MSDGGDGFSGDPERADAGSAELVSKTGNEFDGGDGSSGDGERAEAAPIELASGDASAATGAGLIGRDRSLIDESDTKTELGPDCTSLS